MSLIDPRHPFYRPKWRRAAIVCIIVAWATFEFVAGSPFWGVIFAAIAAYAAWVLILNWPDPEDHPGAGQGEE